MGQGLGGEGFKKKEVSITKYQILIVLIFVKMGELLALERAKLDPNTNREIMTSVLQCLEHYISIPN